MEEKKKNNEEAKESDDSTKKDPTPEEKAEADLLAAIEEANAETNQAKDTESSKDAAETKEDNDAVSSEAKKVDGIGPKKILDELDRAVGMAKEKEEGSLSADGSEKANDVPEGNEASSEEVSVDDEVNQEAVPLVEKSDEDSISPETEPKEEDVPEQLIPDSMRKLDEVLKQIKEKGIVGKED